TSAGRREVIAQGRPCRAGPDDNDVGGTGSWRTGVSSAGTSWVDINRAGTSWADAASPDSRRPGPAAAGRRRATALPADQLMLRGQVWRAGGGDLLGHGPVLICLVNLFTRASPRSLVLAGHLPSDRPAPTAAAGPPRLRERPATVAQNCAFPAVAPILTLRGHP